MRKRRTVSSLPAWAKLTHLNEENHDKPLMYLTDINQIENSSR